MTIDHLNCPLVVDLDGTLTPTDTLWESIFKLIRRSPLYLLFLPIWFFKGRSGFKCEIAKHIEINVELLPYNAIFLEYLRQQKLKGRKLVLATAAHVSIANSVSRHLGIFDLVLATEPGQNLKGSQKLKAIRSHVGDSFVYAGDSKADLPIWRAARGAILVGTSSGVQSEVRQHTTVEVEFPKARVGAAVWFRAFRVHQWVKNVLLFVPLLTAFSFTDPSKLISIAAAFIAFSLGASATYILNDLWDIENDRAHMRKRFRPFASAALPIHHGLISAFALLLVGCLLAYAVSSGFLIMLLLYLVLTTVYSLVLKEYVLMDVIVLALLYTLRILAGSVAISSLTSSWLLAFSVFIFLSLALVKRCAELVSIGQNGNGSIRGRDYRTSDLVVLWPLGVGAALSAVVIFGLFINDPNNSSRYATPELLWLVALGLIYWLGRLWLKTSRGEMHDDPVVYALKNSGSRYTVFGMVGVTIAAHFIKIPPLI
jgi:4-hydroxybenzoate polyprenyltransferase